MEVAPADLAPAHAGVPALRGGSGGAVVEEEGSLPGSGGRVPVLMAVAIAPDLKRSEDPFTGVFRRVGNVAARCRVASSMDGVKLTIDTGLLFYSTQSNPRYCKFPKSASYRRTQDYCGCRNHF